jgi:hypothetical protein
MMPDDWTQIDGPSIRVSAAQSDDRKNRRQGALIVVLMARLSEPISLHL